MQENIKEKLSIQFPFLSCGNHGDEELIGIIQNINNQIVSMYVYSHITDQELKKDFIQCGDEWWWGSNRKIPINIFLKDKFKKFQPFLKTYANKHFTLVSGPSVCIQEISQKKVRRRQIKLVNKNATE